MPESKAGDLVEVAVWQQQAAFTAGVLPVRWLTPLYWLGGLLLLIAYAVLALVLSLNKDWVDSGPWPLPSQPSKSRWPRPSTKTRR